jgi:transposase
VFYRSFNNRRQVGSYVGFPPSPFASGGMSLGQGISKAGNAKTRKTTIELAWLWHC